MYEIADRTKICCKTSFALYASRRVFKGLARFNSSIHTSILLLLCFQKTCFFTRFFRFFCYFFSVRTEQLPRKNACLTSICRACFEKNIFFAFFWCHESIGFCFWKFKFLKSPSCLEKMIYSFIIFFIFLWTNSIHHFLRKKHEEAKKWRMLLLYRNSNKKNEKSNVKSNVFATVLYLSRKIKNNKKLKKVRFLKTK